MSGSGDTLATPPLDQRWSFRVLAEAIKDPVVIWSPLRDEAGDIVDFVYEFVNGAAVDTIGIPSADLVGHRLLEVLPMHRGLGLFDRYREVASTGKSDLIEIPWFEDGNVAGAFEASVSVIGDDVVSVARNVTDRVLAEQRIASSENRYRSLVAELPIPVWINGDDGVIVANDATAALVGFSSASELIGNDFSRYLAADSFRPGDRLSHLAESGEATQSFEVIADLHAGRRHLHVHRRIIDFEGSPVAMWAAIDITDRVAAEHQVEQERQLLRATFASVHSGLLAIDADGMIVDVNQRFLDLTGGPHSIGQQFHDIEREYMVCDEHGEPFPPHRRPVERSMAGEDVTDVDSVFRWPDGRELIVLVSAVPIRSDGAMVGVVLTIQDVTALRAAEAELRALATVDQLTGLPNRRAVLAHLDHAIAKQPTPSDELTVLFLDLDGLKRVNDTLGHEAGDELLGTVGQRLGAMMRSDDLIGRVGGDEFVAVLERLSAEETGNLVARIEAEVARPYELDAGTATIGVSIGKAVHATSHTAQAMLADADAEMYRRKRERSHGQAD